MDKIWWIYHKQMGWKKKFMVLHVMKKMKKNNSGLSLLEALISMVIVGIGFVAILQVTQYSISSVNTSAERTKANFFINIFAEDSLSLRDTSKSENLNDILVVEDSTRFSSECGVQGSKMNVKTATAGDVYRNSTSDNDPILNKSDVAFIKQNPGISAAAAGTGVVLGAGISNVASGTYNVATGQRNVRVKRKTAKQIKQMKKTYNI